MSAHRLKRLAVTWIVAGWSVHAVGAQTHPVVQAAQEAEQSLQARIGLAVLDTADGQLWQYRADERFPMASTSKALICSALLARGPGAMKTAWLIKEEAIQSYAPTTENLIGQYVSAAQLCAITMRNSDNTAANGVLEMLGGPQAVTSFLRTIGDTVTRLDRNEPSLNEATPGDLRDTTTPQAMVQTLQSLVLGDALKTSDRDRLTDWLRHNEVGGPLLRAGVPESWNVADRTGAAGYGTRGVVAVMWPPERAPLVAAVYITETKASMEARNAAIAAIGKVIAQAVDQKAQP
ncbi:class A beta-lactamase [Alcaligenes faecalis]|uniref:class A beta-lactamase n=1 Tax=Alcaligenes faecalis TaxID=511 RepID=UPI000A2DC79C|nr:class A beta-lactamase [Alcaligenes faecalis]KAA1288756.1 class A beta-lactamase [Alcaligenes faecalis]OSZ36464.1 class A beta-lactamase [Alcaligenes faecalis]OSZ46667.1 class A beta-lactamase [Alcaligenes faecalis]